MVASRHRARCHCTSCTSALPGTLSHRTGCRCVKCASALVAPTSSHSTGCRCGQCSTVAKVSVSSGLSNTRGLASMGTALTLLSGSKVALAEGVSAGAAASSSSLVMFLQVAPPLAAQAVFFAPLEAMKTIKSSGTTGDMPLVPYASMMLNGVLWMTYGYMVAEPTIILPNITALLLGTYYVHVFNQYKPPSFNITPYFGAIGGGSVAIAATAAMLEPTLAINVLGVAGNAICIAMFGGPLAAMKTVIEQKSTASLPFAMTVATFVNCSLWVSYGVMISDPYIWFCNGLGLASSLVQFGLFGKYGFAPKTGDTDVEGGKAK